jgi:hypothetical protein
MVMNAKLKEVIDRVSELPDEDQAFVAAIIEEELASEAKWDQLFKNSQPQLEKLGEKALEEYRAGRTEPLDPDNL